ncbi:hypothetical protein DGWBC_0884 [Dehalogenimonas sp. WBC-2]|nr:hypothetical protein DGWBC_0884 [Dehalogenimonas sp. WBC-2]
MNSKLNPYIWAGWSLFIAGILISASSYFILELTWFTAFGLSLLIISFILLALSKSIPKLSPEFSQLLFETGGENLGVLFEELAVSTKAIYIPPSYTSGKSKALIPLATNPTAETLKRPLSNRLIVRYGPELQDIGLLVSTPGTVAMATMETGLEADGSMVGAILTSFFNGSLGIADTVMVSSQNDVIKVSFSQLKHERINDRTDQVLGSAPASVAAAVSAAAWNRPVMISSEGGNARKYDVIIEMLK